MSAPSNTLNTVINLVKTAVGDSAAVTKEFTGNKQELPLKSIVISVGIKKTDVKYVNLEDTTSHQRKMVVEALICAPKNCSSESIVNLLDKIFKKAFESHGNAITLYGFSSDYIRYSSSICALILPIYITVGL